MRPRWIPLASFFVSVVACLQAHALIVAFGVNEIAGSGPGCVGGQRSDHGSVAYYQGDTALLNQQLMAMEGKRGIGVILHAGTLQIDDPVEGQVQLGESASVVDSASRLMVDWSVCQACRFQDVAAGTCDCKDRTTTIHIWVGRAVRLQDLQVPESFHVTSAGDIEKFVKQHSAKKKRRTSTHNPRES